RMRFAKPRFSRGSGDFVALPPTCLRLCRRSTQLQSAIRQGSNNRTTIHDTRGRARRQARPLPPTLVETQLATGVLVQFWLCQSMRAPPSIISKSFGLSTPRSEPLIASEADVVADTKMFPPSARNIPYVWSAFATVRAASFGREARS